MKSHRRPPFTLVAAIFVAGAPALLLAQPTVDARSAIIIDAGSGKVLWEKDADTARYPASTTKIMTSMLLLEHCLPTDIIQAPKDVAKVKESSMHLKPGEKVSARDMLIALMLRSANDGSYAVAKHIGGSVPAFAKMMNDRAKLIGCTNTHFNNPNGLNDAKHWTTARDLALIAREAMKLPPFRDVVRMQKAQISRSINKKDVRMVNRNKWLAKDITADGIKTGYTRPAGFCYVGSATRKGFRVITVLLKSEGWQKDHATMLNWAFNNHEVKETFTAGQAAMEADLEGAAKPVPIAPSETVYTIGRLGETAPAQVRVEPLDLDGPIVKGQRVGDLLVVDGDGYTQRVAAVATEDVPLSAAGRLRQSTGSPGSIALGSALIMGAVWARGRARQRMKNYGRRSPSSRNPF